MIHTRKESNIAAPGLALKASPGCASQSRRVAATAVVSPLAAAAPG